MSEGTHTPSVAPQGDNNENKTTTHKPRSNQWKFLLAGTAGALLIAGAAFQVYQARNVDAAQEGKASLNRQANNASSQKNQAQVGDSLITYDAVARESVARIGNEILEKMINRAIIQQACRKKNIVVTRAEVDREVTKIAKRFNLDAEGWYKMLISERNLSKLQYQRDIIWPMLALKKLAGDDVAVTKEDLSKTFYRDYGPRVKCRMIMMDNQRQLQVVWNAAVKSQKAGPEKALDTFAQLAQKNSIEPTSRALGGQVPPIRRFSGGGNVEKAAFRLKKGEISSIVQVGEPGTARYVVLYCEGRTEPLVTDINKVRERLMTQIKEEKVQIAVAKIFEKLKKETEVKNFLNGSVSGGVRQTSFSNTKTATTPNYKRPQRTTRQ